MFKKGDYVIAKQGAPYGITSEGCVCKVKRIEDSSGEIVVDVVKFMPPSPFLSEERKCEGEGYIRIENNFNVNSDYFRPFTYFTTQQEAIKKWHRRKR